MQATTEIHKNIDSQNLEPYGTCQIKLGFEQLAQRQKCLICQSIIVCVCVCDRDLLRIKHISKSALILVL